MGTRLSSNAVSSMGILAILAAYGVGLPALDRATPAHRMLPDGARYVIGGGIAVVPPPGARLDVGRSRVGRTGGRALFILGTVRYALVVSQEKVGIAEATHRMRTKLRDSAGATVVTEVTEAGQADQVGPAAVRGLAGRFSTTTQDGWYAVYVSDAGWTVEATASGAADALTGRLRSIQLSAASVARTA